VREYVSAGGRAHTVHTARHRYITEHNRAQQGTTEHNEAQRPYATDDPYVPIRDTYDTPNTTNTYDTQRNAGVRGRLGCRIRTNDDGED